MHWKLILTSNRTGEMKIYYPNVYRLGERGYDKDVCCSNSIKFVFRGYISGDFGISEMVNKVN